MHKDSCFVSEFLQAPAFLGVQWRTNTPHPRLHHTLLRQALILQGHADPSSSLWQPTVSGSRKSRQGTWASAGCGLGVCSKANSPPCADSCCQQVPLEQPPPAASAALPISYADPKPVDIRGTLSRELCCLWSLSVGTLLSCGAKYQPSV